MKKNTFVEGTIIASIAIIITKILGAIYVIPFYSIIGEAGGSLYSYAYNIYTLFLDISCAGIPIAMSKIISEYNTLGKYDAKERAYKVGKNLILVISLISFFLLFVFAREAAYIFIGNISGGNTYEDIALVIRSVSFCLLIIPFLSISRGYLQGHKYILPSSTSQVIEQVIRISVILMGSYLTINVFNQSVSIGVSVSLLGAFFGGLVAYLYLKRKIKTNDNLFLKSDKKDKETNKEIRRKIIMYALPSIIICISSGVYRVTDIALVIRGLNIIGYTGSQAETIASIISTWGVKPCMLIVSIASALSISIIPHISSSYVKKNMVEVNNKMNQAIGMMFIVGLPMVIGISILSYPIYTLFYGVSEYGSIILSYLVFSSFFSSLFIVVDMLLQGLNKYKIIYISTITGFIVNALLDVPLVLMFDKLGIYPYYGVITASIIGYSLSFYIAYAMLKKEVDFNMKDLKKLIGKMILPLVAMMIPLIILNIYLPQYTSRVIQIPISLLYALIGSVIYFIITYKNGALYDVFGEHNVERICNKVRKTLKLKG